MKVVIACETSSVELKNAVKQHLLNLGYEITDVGCQDPEDGTLYYEAATNLARQIQSGCCERGIAICGTGAGISLVANRFKGIYCVACESIFTAEKIGLINNANVLAMGSRVVSRDMACEMAEKYLLGKWCEGFAEQRRLNNEKGYRVMQELEADRTL